MSPLSSRPAEPAEPAEPAVGTAQNPKTIYMKQAKRHANKSNINNNANRINNKKNNNNNKKRNKQICVQRKVT